ncbi:MAG: hypothetical protein NVS3B3_03940 [Aquirhabdus sp.]
MFTKFFSKLSVVLIVGSLAACGGGGGSSTSTPPIAVTCASPQVLVNGVCTNPSPTVIPANLQTSVPIPTYQAGSVELQAFNELNNIRKLIGLGLLVQNSKIDLAAANHANYIALNIDANATAFGHSENAAMPGFTGVTPADRNVFAGYGIAVGEDVASNNYIAAIQSPVQSLASTVYHRASILQQCFKDVGIGYRNHVTPIGLIVNPVVIDLGAQNGCQTNASDFTYSYPMANQSNVPFSMTPENPMPFTDMPKDQYGNFDWDKGTSYPITIGVAAGSVLTMDSMTVTEQGSTIPLDMRVLTAANDVNKFLTSDQITFVGKAPFKPSTTYNVVFKGASNGKAFTMSYPITTRAATN